MIVELSLESPQQQVLSTGRKLRLLVVGAVPPPYAGTTELTRRLLDSECLHERFDVLHLDMSDPRPLSNVGKFDSGNIRLALLHGIGFLRILVTKRPDVVYLSVAENVPGFLRDLLFLLPSHVLRRRVVIHYHGAGFRSFFERAPKVLRWLMRLTLTSSRRIIVLGESLRALFDGLVPPDKVVAVMNGVPDVFSDDYAGPAESSGRITVTFLSNMSSTKGAFTFLEAAREVLDTCPDVKFKMAGQWFSSEEYERGLNIAREMNSSLDVLGPVGPEAKACLLRTTDIFVFPPIGPEGLGLVILEAMAAGLPVVATRRGAIAEVVEDGVTGFLADPGDTHAIAQSIVRLIEDETLRRTMGEAGRIRYLANLTVDHWARRMCNVLEAAAVPGGPHRTLSSAHGEQSARE